MNAHPTLPIQMPIRCPLVSLQTAKEWLDRPFAEVEALWLDGQLRWVFDISSPRAKGRRAEYRILRESIEAFHARRAPVVTTFDQVIDYILPHSRETLRSTEMQRVLSCESDHTSELIRSGAWEQVGERPAKTGPNSFYRVARESVIRFLRQRALNH